MKFRTTDYNVLSYLLKKKFMSYEQAVAWAYAQYTDHDIDPFIEKLSLASDAAEMIELISNTYQVYGEPSNEFLAGEAAKAYSDDKLSLSATISLILYDLDLELTEEERQELYIADDYFGWHESAESQALVHAMPFFDRFRAIYERSVAKFSI